MPDDQKPAEAAGAAAEPAKGAKAVEAAKPTEPTYTHVVTRRVATLHANGTDYKPGERIPEGALTSELAAHYEDQGYLVALSGGG